MLLLLLWLTFTVLKPIKYFRLVAFLTSLEVFDLNKLVELNFRLIEFRIKGG